LCIVNSAILSLYAIGRDTGVVVDFGETETIFTPVFHGTILREFIRTYPIGMGLIKEYFLHITTSNVQDARDSYPSLEYLMKSNFEVLPFLEPKEPRAYSKEVKFLYKVSLSGEHVLAPEVYFNPLKLGETPFKLHSSNPSVVQFVYSSIKECEENVQRAMFDCILLTGGGAAITGFSARFSEELKLLHPTAVVVTTANPAMTVVEGAYNFASSSHFTSKLQTRAEYMSKLHPAKDPFFDPNTIVETKVIGSLNSKFQNLFGTFAKKSK